MGRMQLVLALTFLIYVAIGLFFTIGLPRATNVAGRTYFVAAWPLWLKASPWHPPIGAWAFTFKEPTR